jgi:hypothetical protein
MNAETESGGGGRCGGVRMPEGPAASRESDAEELRRIQTMISITTPNLRCRGGGVTMVSTTPNLEADADESRDTARPRKKTKLDLISALYPTEVPQEADRMRCVRWLNCTPVEIQKNLRNNVQISGILPQEESSHL